jgi:general stress protein YciG
MNSRNSDWKQHNIASQGGQASGGSFQPGDPRAREAGRKCGSRTKDDYAPEE